MASTTAGDDSGDQPRPPGVRRPDDSGVRVGEQYGGAVGGEDRERQPAPGGHHRVHGRDLRVRAPGPVHHRDVPAVHLVHPDDAGRVDAEVAGRALAIRADGGGVVTDRAAEVEFTVRSGAHSAPPVGEGEMSAARDGCRPMLTYHFKKSGTSSSSAWVSW